MATIPSTKFELTAIDGGKRAPAAKDPIVKLRFDPPAPAAQKPLTAQEIEILKVLNGAEPEK